MVSVVVVVVVFPVNHTLNMTKFLNVTRNIERALVIKSVLFLGFFQQLHEQRMVDVNHRYDEPLLLLSLTHHNRQAPFWYVPQIFLPMVVVKMDVRNVYMKIEMWLVLISATHFDRSATPRRQNQEKENPWSFLGVVYYLIAGIRKDKRKRYKKKTRGEKGQGSEADMARIKRVKEESVKDLGTLLMVWILQL